MRDYRSTPVNTVGGIGEAIKNLLWELDSTIQHDDRADELQGLVHAFHAYLQVAISDERFDTHDVERLFNKPLLKALRAWFINAWIKSPYTIGGIEPFKDVYNVGITIPGQINFTTDPGIKLEVFGEFGGYEAVDTPGNATLIKSKDAIIKIYPFDFVDLNNWREILINKEIKKYNQYFCTATIMRIAHIEMKGYDIRKSYLLMGFKTMQPYVQSTRSFGQYVQFGNVKATHYKQLASALQTLHEVFRIVHLDIKPDNILYDTSTHMLKLTDFGLSCWQYGGGSVESGGAGSSRGDSTEVDPLGVITLTHRPPEQLKKAFYPHIRTNTYFSDVYSLGAVFYEMFTRERLFPEVDEFGNSHNWDLLENNDENQDSKLGWTRLTWILETMKKRIDNMTYATVGSVIKQMLATSTTRISAKQAKEYLMEIKDDTHCKGTRLPLEPPQT